MVFFLFCLNPNTVGADLVCSDGVDGCTVVLVNVHASLPLILLSLTFAHSLSMGWSSCLKADEFPLVLVR